MHVDEIRDMFPLNIVTFWEENLTKDELITYTKDHNIPNKEGILVYSYLANFSAHYGKYLAFIHKNNCIEYFWLNKWISSKEMESRFKLKAFW